MELGGFLPGVLAGNRKDSILRRTGSLPGGRVPKKHFANGRARRQPWSGPAGKSASSRQGFGRGPALSQTGSEQAGQGRFRLERPDQTLGRQTIGNSAGTTPDPDQPQ